MRNYLLIYLNGQRHEIKGEQAFMSVSDFLRYERGLTGTKVVCAEGDCGACTVLRGTLNPEGKMHYESINSCITFMTLLDCTHLVTVEGLREPHEPLNEIQAAMVNCNGTQCGFCTPGFVCAMTDYVNHRLEQSPTGPPQLNERELRNALTGNLCRCTGYKAILDAGCSLDLDQFVSLQKRYDSADMLADLQQHMEQAVEIQTASKHFFAPTSFSEAAAFKASQPDSKVFSSATDMGVLINKEKANPTIITQLGRVPEAHQIEEQDGQIVVGARVSLTQLENFCRERIPEFARMMHIFASPQIKNKGTLVGNIANASPIGDTLPFLFVAEAEIELSSSLGSRKVNMNDFYTGYKQLNMQDDEIISRVYIPILPRADRLRLYKVSNRKDLDISTFTAAIRLQLAGQSIEKAWLAYGGVGPTILRLPKTEAFLAGKSLDEATFLEAGKIARGEVTPISDVRGSALYRSQLAENILHKFYYEMEETTEVLELV